MRIGGSLRYLALALSPFPGTPPPLPGFLQSLQVRRLVHLGPGLLNMSRSVSHGFGASLSVCTPRKLKLFGHFVKSWLYKASLWRREPNTPSHLHFHLAR